LNKTIIAVIGGRVQGVGYRDWAMRQAGALGLNGYVRNRRDGRVELVLAGNEDQVEDMLALCRRGPRLAVVSHVQVNPSDWQGNGFNVLPTA